MKIPFVSRVYTRPELKEDSKWILLAAGAICLQIGTAMAIGEETLTNPPGVWYLACAFVFSVCALVPIFWLHFVLIAGGTFFLGADVAIRQNPVGVVLVLFGALFSYKMVRYHNTVPGSVRILKNEET